MGGSQAEQASYWEEIAERHMDERVVAKLESDVAHLRSDVTKLEVDVREIRGDIKELKSEVAEHRAETRSEFAKLRTEMGALRSELKGDIAALALTVEKLRGSQRLGFAMLIIVQLLIAGGAPGAIGHLLRLM